MTAARLLRRNRRKPRHLRPARVSLLPAAAMALLIAAGPGAGPTSALPDYAPTVPAGWAAPVVMRPAADATGSSAPDPVTLNGDVTCYMSGAFINSGTTAGTINTTFSLYLDGVAFASAAAGSIPVGTRALLLNPPIAVTGGLHTIGLVADATNILAESDETNNAFARQLSFVPQDLAMGTLATRSAPPALLGGTAGIVGPVYVNVDGLRLPANDQPWEAVALRPPVGQDYDLSLFDATTGIGNGFRAALKSSAVAVGATDFILNNGNFVGAPPHDVGITNYSAGAQPYAIEHRQAATQLALNGNYPGLALASQQMLCVAQYQHLPSVAVPRVLFELTGPPGVVLHLALFNPSTMSIFARSDAMADAASDPTGRAFLDMSLETAGQNKYYGVVVYRDQGDGGTAALTFTLRVRPTPADLTNTQAPGFTVPVNASNAGGNIVNEPTELDGNVPNTTITYYFQNGGSQAASGFSTALRLDGATLNVLAEPPLAAGGVYGASLPPITVPGGRHTLSYQTDVTNVIDEVSETNNSYGKQFVWSPLVMSAGVPVSRPMPADPDAGWSDMPASVTKYPNADGLRINPAAATGVCIATALVPGAGSDVDLSWFTKSTGPANGFTTPLAVSQRGTELTDLVVECRSGFSSGFDIGLIRYGGANVPCTVQSVHGADAGIDPAVIGPATLAAGQVVQAFQFLRFTYVPLSIVLENLSGSADLGMSVYAFDTDGPRNLSTTLPGGVGNGGGAGSSEAVFIDENLLQQTIAVVVWKAGSADVSRAATFRLLIDPNVAGVREPGRGGLGFTTVSGNPFHGSTQLRFDLPEPRDINLDILDVQGRRVCALVSGQRPAGPGAVKWGGTDDAGRAVADGTYFARLAAGTDRRVIKLVLLR